MHFLTLVPFKDIVVGNPYIDKVLLLKEGLLGEFDMLRIIRKEKYDAVIDVQRTGRSKMLTFLSSVKCRISFKKDRENFYYNCPVKKTTRGYTAFERMDLLKGIGIKTNEKYMPKLYYKSKDLAFVKKYLKQNGIDNFFVVSPTARKPQKMWAPGQFGKLADKIYKKTKLMPVVVYGSIKEKQIAEQCAKHIAQCSVIDKPFSIKEFAALLDLSAFFVGNDSFPAHVAVSQNTKAYIICGPTSGWFLESANTVLIYKGLSCQPCNDYKSCKFNLLCYKSLNYSEVFEKISPFLFPYFY